MTYIPYHYYFESSVNSPQNHQTSNDTQIQSGDDDERSYMRTLDRPKAIGRMHNNLSLEDLIELHQRSGDRDVAQAAYEAIDAMGTQEAQDYLSEVGSPRLSDKTILDVPDPTLTEFLSPGFLDATDKERVHNHLGDTASV